MNIRESFDQATLHLILPSKIAQVVDLLSKARGGDPVALMKKFYSSKTYEELCDETSKYWWFSPAELCDLYCREQDMSNLSHEHKGVEA